MKHRLVRAVAALAIALGAVAVPSGAASVQAGSKVCTGWTSSVIPPNTIRVYRHATRTVDVVPFRAYVERVIASEWGPRTAPAAMRAGAITIKQYAWYFAMHWRGKSDPKGHCYDVVDTTMDQLYSPTRRPSAGQRAAIDATWWISLRRRSAFFPTGYRPGTGKCLASHDGWHLYQQDAVDCVAHYGDGTEALLRRFFTDLSYVTPGANDVTGDHRGDALLAVTDSNTNQLTVRILTADRSFGATARRQLTRTLDTTTAQTVLGRASGDVDGNGLADLVQLVAVGSSVEVQVMLASTDGLSAAKTWWVDSSATLLSPSNDLRLVVADFSGDGRADVGIVSVGPETTQLVAMTSTGSAFTYARPVLTVNENLAGAQFAAGNFTGDGRADLLIASEITLDDGAVATALRVAASGAKPRLLPDPRLLAAPVRWSIENVPIANLRFLVSDIDRTGQDDVVIVTSKGAASRILVATSSGAAFRRSWYTGIQAVIPFETTRFSVSDWNGDGRGDVLAYVGLGVGGDGLPLGTAIYQYLSSSSPKFTRSTLAVDPTLAWSTFTAH